MQHRKRAVLRQTVPCSDPQQLGLVGIKLETISGHPLTDICNAVFEMISCRRSVITTAVQIYMCVVGEPMYRYIVLLGYSCEVQQTNNCCDSLDKGSKSLSSKRKH